MSYTSLSVLGVALSVALDWYVLRTRLLARRLFWVSYAIVFGFQLLVNGLLTANRVVIYNPVDIAGGATPALFGSGRIAYAPIEDVLFGFALVVQSLAWWVWWGRRGLDR